MKLETNLQLFGGRGASSSERQKFVVATQSGGTVELSNPLIYGSKDPNVVGAQRAALEEQERKRSKNKIEYGAVYDENGDIIGKEYKGGTSGVKIPSADLNSKGAVYTHNHPRGSEGEEGVIGGTFSSADIETFSTVGAKTFRASATEGTYSMTKGPNYNGKGLVADYKKFANKSHDEFGDKLKDLNKRVTDGKISYSTYRSEVRKAANNMLISEHNWLRENQNRFGYSYRLEEK